MLALPRHHSQNTLHFLHEGKAFPALNWPPSASASLPILLGHAIALPPYKSRTGPFPLSHNGPGGRSTAPEVSAFYFFLAKTGLRAHEPLSKFKRRRRPFSTCVVNPGSWNHLHMYEQGGDKDKIRLLWYGTQILVKIFFLGGVLSAYKNVLFL